MAEAQTPANVSKEGKEPDPSVLTTQQLWREIAHSNELENVKIGYVEKAIALAHQDTQRFPTEIDRAMAQLEKLFDEKLKRLDKELLSEHNLKEEKFNKVEQRFQLIETTRTEQKQEAATALTTALSAAKESVAEQNRSNLMAITKSEVAINKQLEALDSKINDLKERFTRIEGAAAGKKDFWGYIIGGVGLLATLATLVAMVIRNSSH